MQHFKNESLAIVSKYETRWKKQEKDIYDLIVMSEQKSEELDENSAFEVKNLSFNETWLEKIWGNFTRKRFKGDDFFISLEECYKVSERNLLLKFAFGAFYKPEHAYLLLGKKSEFLFKEPFKTKENLKALQKLQEFLYFN